MPLLLGEVIVITGGVASYWKLRAPDPTLPALSVHVPLIEAAALSGPL
jgi:hypothetical protein